MGLALKSWLIFTTVLIGKCSCQFDRARQVHEPQVTTSDNLRYLASLSDGPHFNQTLDNILIPRVVGTQGHEKVFNYIVDNLERQKWHVEVDEFVANTPLFGALPFKNIVARLNPNAERYLVLACHYDSKYFENELFVGAIDSAVPCAMMLNLVKTMSKELEGARNSHLSLKLIFFDGEEAFYEWGPNDSIYGAKHLAQKWLSNVTLTKSGEEAVSHLQRIDLLVLLDLIGAKNPNFHSYYPSTEKWFVRLVRIEEELDRKKLLVGHDRRYFRATRPRGVVEDDHIPFLIRNVPILHLIATPFPPEWHTPGDNRQLVDMTTVDNLNLILRAFVAEYLHLMT